MMSENQRPDRTAFTVLAASMMMAMFQQTPVIGQQISSGDLKQSLHLHVPFDETFDARIAAGSKKIFTAESAARKEVQEGNQCAQVTIAKAAGRFGDALRFADKTKQVLFYQGTNMNYSEKDWAGTVSFWLKLSPDQDLKPGFCDPIQITQNAWNDAAFFVDFDRDLPRDFRLGVFADYKFWNPSDIPWEKLPVTDRPMVVVKKPPFSREQWTHIAFTFEDINSSENKDAASTLYINGKSAGTMKRPLKFHWDPSAAAIMLGLEYIGDFDDLAVFRKALTPAEIQQLFQLPGGVSDL